MLWLHLRQGAGSLRGRATASEGPSQCANHAPCEPSERARTPATLGVGDDGSFGWIKITQLNQPPTKTSIVIHFPRSGQVTIWKVWSQPPIIAIPAVVLMLLSGSIFPDYISRWNLGCFWDTQNQCRCIMVVWCRIHKIETSMISKDPMCSYNKAMWREFLDNMVLKRVQYLHFSSEKKSTKEVDSKCQQYKRHVFLPCLFFSSGCKYEKDSKSGQMGLWSPGTNLDVIQMSFQMSFRARLVFRNSQYCSVTHLGLQRQAAIHITSLMFKSNLEKCSSKSASEDHFEENSWLLYSRHVVLTGSDLSMSDVGVVLDAPDPHVLEFVTNML